MRNLIPNVRSLVITFTRDDRKKHMKKYFKEDIHKKVLYLIILILVPLVAFLLITSRTSLFFGIRTFNVLTGSMRPTISTNSLVFTIPAKSYQVGEIITFQRNDITVTHRIVAIRNHQYQTRGDANDAPDPILVSKPSILGHTFFILPLAGKITTFTKTIPGFILLIVIPTFIFIFFEGKTLKEEWEKEIEKKLVKKLKSVEQTIEKDIKKL